MMLIWLLLTVLSTAYGEYTYYEFAIQKWCADEYMIHGIWPQIDADSYPEYCHDVVYTEPSGDRRSAMETYWRGCDETLWSHEWAKHGSCIANVTEEAFFDLTIRLFTDNYDLVEGCDASDDDCVMGCFDLAFERMDCP